MNAGYSNISILAHAHFEHTLTTPTQTAWFIGKPSSNEFCPAWYQNSMSTYRNWWGLLSTKLCSIYDKSIRPNFFQFSTKVFDKKCFNFRQNVRQIVRQSVRRNRSTKIVSIFDKNVRQKCFEVNSRRFWLFPANNWTDSGFIFVQNWFLSTGLVVWKLVLTILRRNILSEGFGRMYVPSYFRRGPFAPICKPFRFPGLFPGTMRRDLSNRLIFQIFSSASPACDFATFFYVPGIHSRGPRGTILQQICFPGFFTRARPFCHASFMSNFEIAPDEKMSKI